MTFLEAAGAVFASLGVCFSVSLLPFGGGVEVYLLTTSALLPTAFVAPLVLASAAGSVAAKTVVLLGAGRAMSVPNFLQRKVSAKLMTRIQEGPWMRRGLILLLITVGVPSFYALALAAGALGTPRREFIVASLIGQSLRFGTVWAIPQVTGLAA